MRVLDLGRMAYLPAWEVQTEIVDKVVAGEDDTLVFVEHDPVLTLGSSFHEENLLHSVADYEARGIQVVRSDRGGDVTYHGPGQLVIYPIFDLKRHGQDLHKWLRDLEEAVIDALKGFGLKGERFPPHTGVWVNDASGTSPRKIAAIGVKIKKWVSLHGIALNCTNQLDPFDLIVPCGIHDFGVTSLSQALGREVGLAEVKPAITKAFREVFCTPGN